MQDLPAGGTAPRIQYVQTAPGSQREFGYPFRVLSDTDIRVAQDNSMLDPGDYSVSGIGDPSGGTVTLNGAPPVGSRITVWRQMPLVSGNGFASGTEIGAPALNEAFDRLVMMAQQVAEDASNAVRPALTDVIRDLTLPPLEERAGKFLSFDSQGCPETVAARYIGNLQNFGLIYLGSHAGTSPPELRLNGTALRSGDLYFDSDDGLMKVWRGNEWAIAATPDPTLFRHDGSLSMTGDLDLGGHNIVNAGLIDGRNIATDGTMLDALSKTIADWELASRIIALRNAWEIARLRGLTAYALSNTYLDTFEDLTGLETGQMAIPPSDGTIIHGTDGTLQTMAGIWGPELAFDRNSSGTGIQATGDATQLHVGKDWGDGQSRTVTRVRAWGEPTEGGFASQAATCALAFQGSQTGAWAGEEITLWSDPTFEDPGGAHVEFDVVDTTTAYRFHRFLVEETQTATSLQIMELELFAGHHAPSTSTGIRLVDGEGIANGDPPASILSTESHWLPRAGFVHTGDSLVIDAAVGAIRTKLPLRGNFELTLSLGASGPDHLWQIGLVEDGDIGNFDPAQSFGGLPIDSGATSGLGVENGIAVSVSQNHVRLLRIEQNIVHDDGTAATILSQGDEVSVVRHGVEVSVKVNGIEILQCETTLSACSYGILGSHTTPCGYESIAWNLNHDDPMTLVSKGITAATPPEELHILIEADGVHRGENNLTHSNDFLASAWNKAGATVQAHEDPGLGHTVFRIEETESPGVHAMIRIVSIVPGQVHTASLFAKAAERTKLRLLWGNQSTSRYAYAIYDLTNGTASSPVTVDTVGAFNAEIQPVGNGWYRCAISGELDSVSDQGQLSCYLLRESNFTHYPGNPTMGAAVYGAQLESAPSPGPYFETTDTAVGPRVVLERDFLLEASRNDGLSWQTASLANSPVPAFDRLIAHYVTDFFAEPTGQTVRLRLSLDRPEPIRINRWAVQADCLLSIST